MNRRQKIADIILSRLSNISQVNGYSTDMGAQVTRWKTNINKASLPMSCNIKDSINEHERGHKESLRYEFELSCRHSDNYTTITNMVQDLQACLTSFETELGSAISSQVRWIPESEEVNISLEGESEIAEATVVMILEHRFTSKWTLDRENY
jgi:hypothetical protein